MNLIETITAIPSRLVDIPDRGPGMFFRFIDEPERKGIYELGEKMSTPMVNLWRVKGENVIESAGMTEYINIVRERAGTITRLRDFPELKKGNRFRITEGEHKGRFFTLQSLYNSGPYWVVSFDEVGSNESAWNIISTWVEVEPVYPAPAPDRLSIDPVALQKAFDGLSDHVNKNFREQAEAINRQDKFLGYVASQLNILIEIANLSVNSDNLGTIQALLRPLNYMRDNYLKEFVHYAAKPKAGPYTEPNEENRAAGSRAAGASFTRFESSTPDSQ